MQLTRCGSNPLLRPDTNNEWESFAAFNGNVFKHGDQYKMVYRAISNHRRLEGKDLRMSSVGMATSVDGIDFKKEGILIRPELPWDRFGCEDPRATILDGNIFIFYTAVGAYPFVPDHIRVGVAIFSSLDLKPIRHLVTPFNAKAMALFPEKINGKYAVILSVNTDNPPATVGIALLDKIEDLWCRSFWHKWHSTLSTHALQMRRLNTDQVEVGAPPLRVKQGWLLVYCRIQNYGHSNTLFGIEVALLDGEDPKIILARTQIPVLTPKDSYEIHGTVPNIVFPSGALIVGEELHVYYGGGDTVCALATCHLPTLMESLTAENTVAVTRSKYNPVLTSRWDHPWERMGVYNPGVFQDNDQIHVVYRGQDNSGTSFMGLATFSAETEKLINREPEPIYSPRENFEEKAFESGNSGCEDPRLTLIDERVYMLYTAYRGDGPPRVALTSISLKDFRCKNWKAWTKAILISPPGIADKDACFFPEKINEKYVTIHRIEPDIVFDYRMDLNFDGVSQWLQSQAFIAPRKESWEGVKIGANAPPLKTSAGWLLLYHGVATSDNQYRLGAMLLDLNDPAKIIGRSLDPLLEPEEGYERFGQVRNVVFPCGMGLWKDRLLIFYGGADSCTCLATLSLTKLLAQLKVCGDVR